MDIVLHDENNYLYDDIVLGLMLGQLLPFGHFRSGHRLKLLPYTFSIYNIFFYFIFCRFNEFIFYFLNATINSPTKKYCLLVIPNYIEYCYKKTTSLKKLINFLPYVYLFDLYHCIKYQKHEC